VGILRPVVLLPVASLNHMTTEQLEMIFAHELAHIQRNDHRLIFLQRLTETILFFHPAVWILSRWLDREREHACDDIVVSTGASRAGYAETLVAVSRMNPDPAGLLQLAAASDVSSELAKRVHRLLQISPPLRFSRGSFSLALAIALSLWFFVAPSDQIVASDKESAKAEVTELEVLKKRVRELEALTDPVLKRKAAEQTLRKNRDSAAARAEMDRGRYARKEFLEIEARYRKAVNGTLEELEEFVTAFPGSNRTGCAVLLLGRRSETDHDKEKWLKEAIENYSDCYYPDGVQVGPYARFFLAHLYQAQGKTKQAGEIFAAIKDGFPEAVSHDRTLLKVMINELADRPKVVAASPDNGDRTVSPDTKEIRIEFDRPMDPSGFSFVGGGSNYPEVTGRPRWIDSKTVVLPVTLRHSHDYFLSINSDSYKNFRSEQGFQAVSYPIRFKTAATP
ncbi:MAG: M56 family metallopeptidase, partial [Verrucomicrobiales bacterium]|nr:M56 family metallopeptidase [Verrucomicrobiales bacterium]